MGHLEVCQSSHHRTTWKQIEDLGSLVVLFFNSFTELQFTYHPAHCVLSSVFVCSLKYTVHCSLEYIHKTDSQTQRQTLELPRGWG